MLERLRAPGGCAWDREQTHGSLVQYLLEESYELVDAIEAGDDAELIEELGDVLYQVLFHADIAAEDGRFTLEDVAAHMTAKMVSRHPHVFGDVVADTPDAVIANWEVLKAVEKSHRTSVLDGIPDRMPSLLLAPEARRPCRTRRSRASRDRHPRDGGGTRRRAARDGRRRPRRRLRPRARPPERPPHPEADIVAAEAAASSARSRAEAGTAVQPSSRRDGRESQTQRNSFALVIPAIDATALVSIDGRRPPQERRRARRQGGAPPNPNGRGARAWPTAKKRCRGPVPAERRFYPIRRSVKRAEPEGTSTVHVSPWTSSKGETTRRV